MRDLFDPREASDADPVRKAQRLSKPDMPRRFYETVAFRPEGDDFLLLLDGRPVRTPGGRLFAVPTEGLARELVTEWAAQLTHINPATMPLTRLVNAAIDGVEVTLEPTHAAILAYGRSDLLCYRASEPERLAARQTELWDPVLDWARTRHGIRLVLSSGVMPVAQEDSAIAALAEAMPRGPALLLAALHSATTLSGSALLALALHDRRLTAAAAWAAAHVDEDWNMELWGRDAEALERRLWRQSEFDAAVRVIDALAPAA